RRRSRRPALTTCLLVRDPLLALQSRLSHRPWRHPVERPLAEPLFEPGRAQKDPASRHLCFRSTLFFAGVLGVFFAAGGCGSAALLGSQSLGRAFGSESRSLHPWGSSDR